jgi:hypothetical protein
MDENTTSRITAELQERYPEVGIKSISVNEETGTTTFLVDQTKKSLAFLKNPLVSHTYKEHASTLSRDAMSRSYLDLANQKDYFDEDPKKLYEKAMRYYYTEPIIGSVVNLLSSLACKGFENDLDDPNIKNFYDTWVFDVNFEEVIEWIFLELFKTSHVTTYKYIAKYEPRVSNIQPAGKKTKTKSTGNLETSAKKNVWSKGFLPIGYTVLNPTTVNITGNLLFDNVSVSLTPPKELGDLLKKDAKELTDEDKALIKALPPDLKKAATGGGEYKLDSGLVGSITYKKQPYERYARPRITRVFESIEYKQALRNADLSTLDGISNYILKITIGNDEYPVVSQEELESVAKLFDTPSKSFDVVWNHTLKIEKIISPEIESILGKGKYEQVNEDITGGLAFSRALLDSTTATTGAEWAIGAVKEDINYARRQVTRWIYNEYRQIAEAMGFDRFPSIRWDESILRNDILYKNVISSMVDRRMLSYKTSLETLGFDYENELANMKSELSLVKTGIFGLKGSPFQQSAPVKPGDTIPTTQDTQNAPPGTPSKGRPTGTTNVKTPETDPSKLQASLQDIMSNMSSIDRELLIKELIDIDNNL